MASSPSTASGASLTSTARPSGCSRFHGRSCSGSTSGRNSPKRAAPCPKSSTSGRCGTTWWFSSRRSTRRWASGSMRGRSPRRRAWRCTFATSPTSGRRVKGCGRARSVSGCSRMPPTTRSGTGTSPPTRVWWNEGFEKLFGYRREDVDPTAKSWTDCIHPDDLARVTAGIHHVIEHGGEGWADEYRFRRLDGDYAYVLDRGHVIRDGAGVAVRMIGGMTDLTERKETENALRESNEKFHLLADNITDAFWIRSPDMRTAALRQPGLRADLGPFGDDPVRQSAAVDRLHAPGGPRACGADLRRAHAQTRPAWTSSIASCGPTARSAGSAPGDSRSVMPPAH